MVFSVKPRIFLATQSRAALFLVLFLLCDEWDFGRGSFLAHPVRRRAYRGHNLERDGIIHRWMQPLSVAMCRLQGAEKHGSWGILFFKRLFEV